MKKTNSGLNEHTEIFDGTAPKILKEEVLFATKNMKKGIAPGDDRITLDILKEAGEYVEDILAKFFTKCCKIEYAELCKTLRKNMKEDIRKFNCELVRKAIETNKSLRVVKRSLFIGKKHVIALKGEDGTVTRNRKEILRRI